MQTMQAGILANGARRGDAQGRRWIGLALVAAALAAGCASRETPAPITHLPSGEVRQPAQIVDAVSVTHTVVPGDTLFSIARRYGERVESLASLNQISDPSQLRVGQVLYLRGAPAASTSTSTSATTQPVASGTQPAVAPSSAASSSASSPSGSAAPITTAAPRASDANLVRWDWPASGRILQAFTVNTKGIDLEGKIGDPVKAAADGTVAYAGNGVRGLGNLILLNHSDGFISAYAHNQTLLVKTGQKIQQGTQIASIGQSDTTSPRLHFEIRRRGTPVNPLSYLPAR